VPPLFVIFNAAKLEIGLKMLAFAEHHRTRTSPVAAASAFRAAIVAVALALLSGYAYASDPTGLWLIEDGSAKVRVQACGDALCGNVHWIKKPNDPADGMPWLDKNNVDPGKRSRPLLGLPIAIDMKPSDVPDKWVGHVYSVDFGKTFDGSFRLLNPRKLKIEGCLMLICQAEIWSKAD
jgi:uncharacterized protein (DUF2147 family)